MPTSDHRLPYLQRVAALLRGLARRVRALFHTSRGKDLLIFLLFILVSYAFWLVMTLNEEAQRELHVPLRITDLPEQYTFISDVPENVQVSVRDKGSSLFRYSWGGMPQLRISYSDMRRSAGKDSRLVFTEQEMSARVRSLFGAQAQVNAIHPDSLSLIYTDRPGRRVKVIPEVNASTAWNSVIAGAVTVQPDSVTVYTVPQISGPVREARTLSVNFGDLSETLTTEVRLQPVPGARMVPDRVTVTVPVEPLIAKQRSVNVSLIGAPHSASVVLFPSRVDVTYLVPMSAYNNEVGAITVVADYSHRSTATARIPVHVTSAPDLCHSITLATDSVEYLLEQKAPVATPVTLEPQP